jgi:hypothetical protein
MVANENKAKSTTNTTTQTTTIQRPDCEPPPRRLRIADHRSNGVKASHAASRTKLIATDAVISDSR